MSIRLIAKDLYRLMAEVEEIERRIENCAGQDRPKLEAALRKKKAERDYLRRALDGKKE